MTSSLRSSFFLFFLFLHVSFASDFYDWINTQTGVSFSCVAFSDGLLKSTCDIKDRTVVVIMDNSFFFGYYSGDDPHSFPDEETKLILLLLRNWIDDNPNLPWRVFTDHLKLKNSEIKEVPALLWDEKSLEQIQHTYLLDRISEDRKLFDKYNKLFAEFYPELPKPSDLQIIEALRLVEMFPIKIREEQREQQVLPFIVGGIDYQFSKETDYLYRDGKFKMWVDDIYQAGDQISASFVRMTTWRMVELFGYHIPFQLNPYETLPVDLNLRAGDKLFKIKQEFYQKNISNNRYPLVENDLYIDGGGIYSKKAMALLRLKHLSTLPKDLKDLNLYEIQSQRNEIEIYKNLYSSLHSRISRTYSSDITQDQEIYEKIETQEDPVIFSSLAIKIVEKRILLAAMRRSNYLVQQYSKQTLKDEKSTKNSLKSTKDIL